MAVLADCRLQLGVYPVRVRPEGRHLRVTTGAVQIAADHQTVRLFKTSCSGTSSRSFVMTWAGVYDSVGDYTSNNGNTTVQLSGHAVYSSADTLFWGTTVVNGVATLP